MRVVVGKARGYVYCTTPYGEQEIEFVCPVGVSIADGTASEKLGAIFSDSSPLAQAAISKEIIDEVTLRTPGYISWQQESWIDVATMRVRISRATLDPAEASGPAQK